MFQCQPPHVAYLQLQALVLLHNIFDHTPITWYGHTAIVMVSHFLIILFNVDTRFLPLMHSKAMDSLLITCLIFILRHVFQILPVVQERHGGDNRFERFTAINALADIRCQVGCILIVFLGDPWMLESLFGGDTLGWVICQ